MNYFKFLVINLSFVTVIFSCQNKSENFVVNKSSKTIENLIHVELIDIVDGQEKIVTTEYLKKKWETEFNDEFSIKKVRFNTFEILETEDPKTKISNYFLKAVSTDRAVEKGVYLKRINSSRFSIN